MKMQNAWLAFSCVAAPALTACSYMPSAFSSPREANPVAAAPARAQPSATSAAPATSIDPAPAAARTPPAATATPPAAAAPAAPPPIQPLSEALVKAAGDLFSKAQIPPPSTAPYAVVIDPLVDGATGAQSNATRSLEERIRQLARQNFPRFNVRDFSSANVRQSPVVLIGTFTAVNNAGQANAARDAFRICLALADLRSGRIVAKGTARAHIEGVDVTPTAHFRDSPAWFKDAAVDAYIKTCQGTKVGDAIDPKYLDGILVATLVSDAIDAYNAGRYRDALAAYESAARMPGGEQLRVLNGLYLSNTKLGRRDDASNAFGRIIDFGLANDRLALNFLFRPGSTAWSDARISSTYETWLRQLARRAVNSNACLEISGHTSPTGPAALNDRLSLLRAEYVKQRLEAEAPPLAQRSIAVGKGARENIVGTGSDNAADALDRRVEFRVLNCG